MANQEERKLSKEIEELSNSLGQLVLFGRREEGLVEDLRESITELIGAINDLRGMMETERWHKEYGSEKLRASADEEKRLLEGLRRRGKASSG